MKLRTLWPTLGWLWIAVIVYFSLTPHPPEPLSFEHADKLEHMLSYGLIMLWFCQLRCSRIGLAAGFVAMGIGLEYAQDMTGYRYFEYADMLANSAGVMAGWLLARTRMGSLLELTEQYGKQ